MASRVSPTLAEGQSQFKTKVRLGRGLIRQLKSEGTKRIWNRNGKLRRVKPLKKMGRSKRKAMTLYLPLRDEFLAQPENKHCFICTVRREHGENILIQLATEVHHWAGRIGRLLCYVPYFKPSCRGCREWPHQHGELAREYGLLAPAAVYNVFPGDGGFHLRSTA